MKYILTPKNEGQEMNCKIEVSCSKSEAMKVASVMAANLTTALLLQCEIAVHIETVSEGLRGDEGILACHDGRFMDCKTGNFLKVKS